MAAAPTTVAVGARVRNIGAGSVTVTAAVIIAAVIMSVVAVTAGLSAVFQGTHRTTGIRRLRIYLSVMSMSLGWKRHKSGPQQAGSHSCRKSSAPHGDHTSFLKPNLSDAAGPKAIPGHERHGAITF